LWTVTGVPEKGGDLRLEEGRLDAVAEVGAGHFGSCIRNAVELLRALLEMSRRRATVRTECDGHPRCPFRRSTLQARPCPCIGFPQVASAAPRLKLEAGAVELAVGERDPQPKTNSKRVRSEIRTDPVIAYA